MRHTAARVGGKEQNVAGLERIDDGGHFGPGLRLLTAPARQPDAVLTVGELNEARAVEAVRGRAAPLVGRAERVQRGTHDVPGAPDDHQGWRRRR